MAPPPEPPAELSERVELEMLRVPPLFKKAPPEEFNFAPETVTPEMERLPPLTMLKILKLRVELLGFVGSLPLMVSEEEPGPVMVRVPRVPPEIAVLALRMVGNCVVNKVMVPAPPENREEAKSMVSLPAVVLARSMASLKVITLSLATVSAKEVT